MATKKLKGPYWKLPKDIRWSHLQEAEVLARAGGELYDWLKENRITQKLFWELVSPASGYDTLRVLKRFDPEGVPIDLMAFYEFLTESSRGVSHGE